MKMIWIIYKASTGYAFFIQFENVFDDTFISTGIALILGSQLVSASQMVVEELFLKKRSLHPLHVSV